MVRAVDRPRRLTAASLLGQAQSMSSNGNGSDAERGSLSPREREALRQRASELGKRLDEVRERNAPASNVDPRARGNAMGQAFKITAELLVGVVLGGGIGWALDRHLGTAPWLLVLMLVLGFAAGLSNVIRSARRMQAQAEPLQRAAPSIADDDDGDDQPAPKDPRGPPTGGRST